MYYLFLDDERAPRDVKWVELPPANWVIVRSYDAFVKTIEEKGVPEFVTFDHDLGPKAYAEYTWAHSNKNVNRGKFNYETLGEKTGFDCAKWFVQYCLDNNKKIPDYQVHSMNPIGKENIISLIEQGKRIQNGPIV